MGIRFYGRFATATYTNNVKTLAAHGAIRRINLCDALLFDHVVFRITSEVNCIKP